MFPVTITLHDAAELNTVLNALNNPQPAERKVEAPKPSAKAEKPAEKVAKPATASPSEGNVTPAVTATASPTASTASSSEPVKSAGLTAEELTKVIVAAVARTSRDAVLGLLKDEFGVSAGKEITDPAVRAQAAAKIGAL